MGLGCAAIQNLVIKGIFGAVPVVRQSQTLKLFDTLIIPSSATKTQPVI